MAWRLQALLDSEGVCLLCSGDADEVHHVVYSQHLRRRARELGIDADVLLWDVRNAMPLCGDPCHRRHHSRRAPIPFDRLPAAVHDFAAEFGLTYHLERYYPKKVAA